MYGYRGILECGWKTGVHDVRGLRYQHRWLVVHRPSGTVAGYDSRHAACNALKRLRAGQGVGL